MASAISLAIVLGLVVPGLFAFALWMAFRMGERMEDPTYLRRSLIAASFLYFLVALVVLGRVITGDATAWTLVGLPVPVA